MRNNESTLPGLISENSDSEVSESDEEGVFNQQRAQETFDDFVLSLPLELRWMLGVILMESFKTRQKMNVKDAAKEAGSIVGFNEKTVRRHRNDFFGNEGKLTLSRQGKYKRHCVYHNKDLNRKAREWVGENAFKKGEPNMNAAGFCEFVNNKLLPSSYLPPYFPRLVSLRTAIRWLCHLGFKPRSHKKGVYIDGHEREDVVKHKVEYLKTMEELRKTHKPPPQCSDEEPRMRVEEDEEKKTLVVLYHDKSIYNTNEGQSWMWAEDDHPALLPKTKGSGIMVADFIDEHNGYLQLTPRNTQLIHLSPNQPELFSSMVRRERVIGPEKGLWRMLKIPVTLRKSSILPASTHLSSYLTNPAVIRSMTTKHFWPRTFWLRMVALAESVTQCGQEMCMR